MLGLLLLTHYTLTAFMCRIHVFDFLAGVSHLVNQNNIQLLLHLHLILDFIQQSWCFPSWLTWCFSSWLTWCFFLLSGVSMVFLILVYGLPGSGLSGLPGSGLSGLWSAWFLFIWSMVWFMDFYPVSSSLGCALNTMILLVLSSPDIWIWICIPQLYWLLILHLLSLYLVMHSPIYLCTALLFIGYDWQVD
ncbi:hypothetical protein BDB01DRAFT_171985 [Pilobolus umbonatus]|nr:hypothetical protein BDB01DRAFT_171985 [Pilobolus umbonatus]